MDRPYKISFKTYFNDKLKQVQFGTKLTHPLYVQVTFERKTIFFKSNFFELFSKTKYILAVAGLMGGPSIDKTIEMEMELIRFIADRHPDDFSLDLFKKEYAYYSQDLCDLTEEGFRDYLYTFFQDKGMPAFAVAIREGSRQRFPYDVIRDMKKAFTKPFYDEVVENSLYYAPPYLPLYGFMLQTKQWPMLSLTIMEWETGDTQTRFEEYVEKYYPGHEAGEIKKSVERWISRVKKL